MSLVCVCGGGGGYSPGKPHSDSSVFCLQGIDGLRGPPGPQVSVCFAP